jgi:hypothetical protein
MTITVGTFLNGSNLLSRHPKTLTNNNIIVIIVAGGAASGDEVFVTISQSLRLGLKLGYKTENRKTAAIIGSNHYNSTVPLSATYVN